MISMNQIVRLAQAGEHRQLIVRILANGRCRSELARRVLCRADAAPVASLGLALQRLTEILYQRSSAADQVARRIVDLQRCDGLFGDQSQPLDDALLGASAVALRGLITWMAQNQGARDELAAAVAAAIGRGLDALQGLHAQGEKRIAAPGAGWAIVLWQLGDVDSFRAAISVRAVLEMLDEAGADFVEDELCRYAHAMAA